MFAELESCKTQETIETRLSAPFPATVVRFRSAVFFRNQALAVPYIDLDAVRQRLDDEVGASGWKEEYESLPEGAVVCRLRIRIGDQWITRMDVGPAGCQALSRAAARFGIGSYLYRLPAQWVEFDAAKGQFVRPPTLLVTDGLSLQRSAQSTKRQPKQTPRFEARVRRARPTRVVA